MFKGPLRVSIKRRGGNNEIVNVMPDRGRGQCWGFWWDISTALGILRGHYQVILTLGNSNFEFCTKTNLRGIWYPTVIHGWGSLKPFFVRIPRVSLSHHPPASNWLCKWFFVVCILFSLWFVIELVGIQFDLWWTWFKSIFLLCGVVMFT